jgi:hypothetical protein
MYYNYRLKVRVRTPINLNVTQQFDQLYLPSFAPIEVSQMADGEFFIFVGRGYSSEDAAHSAGRKLADTLLLAGALHSLGVDVGYDRPGPQFSQAIVDAIGKEVRGGVFGLMAYRDDGVVILDVHGEGSVSNPMPLFQEIVTPCVGLVDAMSVRQRISASLLNDACRSVSVETAFILRVTAVEALCEQTGIGSQGQQVVDALQQHLDTLAPSEVLRETLRRVLVQAAGSSVRQAYMSKIRRLLGRDRADAFDALYGRRSKYLHEGEGRGDLAIQADEARHIATDLLKAELEAAL